MFEVTEAEREKEKAVVGFIGCSGSGKTVSALVVAYGMMKEAYPDASEAEIWLKIGVVDTEHRRSKLYANLQIGDIHIGKFRHIDFTPPFTTERYQMAVRTMKAAGAEVVIVDSISHNWMGEGGIVETHGQMSGNSFQNWGKLAPETTKLIKTLTQNDVHILATFRTKTEYVVEQNSEGKMAPRKVGTKPVQKEEMEYEFMLNFVIDIDHVADISKDNTQMFEGKPQKITVDIGRKLYQWLELGIDVKAEEDRKRAEIAEQEAKEKAEAIKAIKKIVKDNDAAAKLLSDFEFKANAKLEDFTVKWAQAALDKITNQLGGK